MNQYEAMFLFDPTFGSTFEPCEAEIRRLIERAQGQIILCRKWDERRLAYAIKGRTRGVYVLVYFKIPPDKVAQFERDAKLSESILRLLVIRAESITPELMEEAFHRRSEEPARTHGAGKPRSADASSKPTSHDEAASASEPKTVMTETAVVDEKTDEAAETK